MKAHLALRSDFSLGESLLQVDKLVAQAKTLGYESLALTDTCSLHGMVDFTNRCDKAGIKPITAVTLRVYDDPTRRKEKGEKWREGQNVRLKVYVLNEKGFAWLLKTLTLANSEERFYYNPRSGWDDFVGAEGIAVATGDFFNLFSHSQWEDKLRFLIGCLTTDNVYAELSPVNTPLFDRTNAMSIEAAATYGLPHLLTYPALYAEQKHAESLDILNLVMDNGRTSDSWRPKQFVKEFHLQEPAAMLGHVKAAAVRQAKFEGKPEPKVWIKAIRDTEALVNRVEYKFSKMPVNLPQMAPDEFKAVAAECVTGWKRRFAAPVLGHQPSAAELDARYKPRLKYELDVLKNMGFSGYFLLAQDIVQWSKQNGIIVGPGRGSVGGSLVAYLMGITDVDPIRFNLLFERFINPERLDLPDADLDFMSSRRHEVITYLQNKYGHDKVAGISNYGTMASASAVRDTGRVFGLQPFEMTATKLVPKTHGQSATLEEAAAQVPEIDLFKQSYPEVWGHALVFEGCMRSLGQHAAGVVVARDPLVTRAVVETRTEVPVVSWDKRVVEDFGLVKLDILGLSTLDVLAIAANYIKERHGIDVNYLNVPLDDAEVLDAFGKGDTTGVFQFESPGMRNLLRELAKGGPLTFDDITAATALYRPGPMDSGLLEDFVNIKQGNRLPSYEHPLMEPALKDTYSVIVYQEQVMQVAVDLAGFTRAEADHLRKAMGKKDKDKMAEMRQKWVDGCFKTAGMDDKRAGALFDKIEAFAGYGFNKSHAVEYSVISVWTMWLRVKYPAEYFAACMSIVKEDKLPGLVKDAREYGIEVFPPDINLSTDRYRIVGGNTIIAPFNSVLGCSDSTARRIVELRDQNRDWKVVKVKRNGEQEWGPDEESPIKGRFDSADEFVRAAGMPKSGVNARVVERLERVGALAGVTPGAKPPRHPDRRKDQTELMPGLIIDVIKADRVTDMTDGYGKVKIIHLVQEYAACEDCSLKNSPHPAVRIPKSKVRFMVVTDSPSWQEEKEGKLLVGDSADAIKQAIGNAGLAVGEGYYTTLVKSRKPTGEKFLTNEQINGCRKYLERELEIIKPAIIVALGSATARHFSPDSKASASELVGKAVYDSKLDATVVFGINPAQLAYDPSKQEILNEVFKTVAEIAL
jgi:DNA polymerase-3 subunit alpha